jgi:hypothetical protein
MSATAHNWTTCLYTDEGGNASTLPSLTGNSGNNARRLDHPLNQWFAPLASGDVGIRTLTQMQCSATVTGICSFVIGHPLGFLTVPISIFHFLQDFVSRRSLAPRVFDDACLAFLDCLAPINCAPTISGHLELTNAG